MLNLFLDWKLWGLDVLLALITVSASVAKYEIGKGGFKTLQEHYPRLKAETWEKAKGYFDRWGAPFILISFVPILTWIIPAAAGAFGIGFRTFLVFAFLAKVIRYWILILLFFGAYQVVT